jgi:ATPase family protein associated with various cellular activities (AAA)/winged helix domain-containing protein
VRTPTPGEWLEANQRYLTAALTELRAMLSPPLPKGERMRLQEDEPPSALTPPSHGEGNKWDLPVPPALESLTARFGLSEFETNILLLCAGVELDSRIAALCADAQGEGSRGTPTFSLALGLLPGPHWSALLPSAPLRYWRLVETSGGGLLTQSTLRIDERILHYLTGISYLDDRLMGYIGPLARQEAPQLVASHRSLVEQMVSVWMPTSPPHPSATGKGGEGSGVVVQLFGNDAPARQQIAEAACERLGLGLHTMRAAALPANPVEQAGLLRLWERETLLNPCALLLVCDEPDAGHVLAWIDAAEYPLIISTRERLPVRNRFVQSFEVAKPTPGEQSILWRDALGPLGGQLNGRVDTLVSQFSLSAETIQIISADALRQGDDSPQIVGDLLWEACGAYSTPRLGELAQRIHVTAEWDDLILPPSQKQILEDIALHARHRLKVYQTWGFAARSSRGLGISALFAGPSGTGKTMAAEVLARRLKLELFRIDLSQVVSKYIGETEKNLRRVFDAAEESGAILFFDEADALFGKRTEVKDSHDRYANVEINYLLQRMEAYRGLAILATNLKESLDQAFMRRLRFVINFPFPGPAERLEIWKHVFPAQTPIELLDFQRLSRLSVTGGSIRNIAMCAAFLAAEAGTQVGMSQIHRASRAEFSKLERAMSEAEIGASG